MKSPDLDLDRIPERRVPILNDLHLRRGRWVEPGAPGEILYITLGADGVNSRSMILPAGGSLIPSRLLKPFEDRWGWFGWIRTERSILIVI